MLPPDDKKSIYLGNFRPELTKGTYFFPPEKYENKNVTPEQTKDFTEFLKNHQKVK